MEFLEDDYPKFYAALKNDFWREAENVFNFQSQNNSLYKKWLEIAPKSSLDGEPFPYSFLPISFFKRHNITSLPSIDAKKMYKSSGTTGSTPSCLALYRPEWYKQNTITLFEEYFGASPSEYKILALLPSYLDGRESSLVDMVKDWMSLSPEKNHGFYLHDMDTLVQELKKEEKTLLIGVSFAMIDLAERINFPLDHCLIIETGGMKGKRKEWTKSRLHDYLSRGFGQRLYSEYGMTELTSQCYMKQDQAFKLSPTMRLFLRDETQPNRLLSKGRGALNIIDLANMDTLSFIATDDLAQIDENGNFEILGRLNNSDIRGCSQMYFEK